jgi:hypothetical protein
MVVDLQDTPKITSCCGRKGHWYAYANQTIENWIDLHETETFANWTASPHYRSASDQKLAYFFWTGTRSWSDHPGQKRKLGNRQVPLVSSIVEGQRVGAGPLIELTWEPWGLNTRQSKYHRNHRVWFFVQSHSWSDCWCGCCKGL